MNKLLASFIFLSVIAAAVFSAEHAQAGKSKYEDEAFSVFLGNGGISLGYGKDEGRYKHGKHGHHGGSFKNKSYAFGIDLSFPPPAPPPPQGYYYGSSYAYPPVYRPSGITYASDRFHRPVREYHHQTYTRAPGYERVYVEREREWGAVYNRPSPAPVYPRYAPYGW